MNPSARFLDGDVTDVASALNVPTIPLPPPRPVTRFHVGLRPGSPAWHHNIYGVCFSQTSSTFTDDGKEQHKMGCIAELDADQLRKVRDGVQDRVVRWIYGRDPKTNRNRKVRAEIWDRNTAGFRPEYGDEPLAPYLIFEKINEEFLQPTAPEAIFADMEDAIKTAEKQEQKALSDPRDAKIRARAADAKLKGQKLDDDAV